ncbi:hypothetical protein BP6252_04860 [Coleophoma cylindrospora]|uniref:Uncharacterized protein n=1 Tax=Coleophoma cylindrospora TaxID=1849047 RepID=A0A3D8S1N3_9HELO|nr:hypothetical protein BP6252_04860 [Coleophoma cylindrospora]
MALDEAKSKASCTRISPSKPGPAENTQHKQKGSHEHARDGSNYRTVPRPWLHKPEGTNSNAPMPSANFAPSPMIELATSPRMTPSQLEIQTFAATKCYSPLSAWVEELPCSQPFHNLGAVRVPGAEPASLKSGASVEYDINAWSTVYYDPSNQDERA